MYRQKHINIFCTLILFHIFDHHEINYMEPNPSCMCEWVLKNFKTFFLLWNLRPRPAERFFLVACRARKNKLFQCSSCKFWLGLLFEELEIISRMVCSTALNFVHTIGYLLVSNLYRPPQALGSLVVEERKKRRPSLYFSSSARNLVHFGCNCQPLDSPPFGDLKL